MRKRLNCTFLANFYTTLLSGVNSFWFKLYKTSLFGRVLDSLELSFKCQNTLDHCKIEVIHWTETNKEGWGKLTEK